MPNHDSDRSPDVSESSAVSRRALLAGAAGLAASVGLGRSARAAGAASQPTTPDEEPAAGADYKIVVSNGRLNQSVVWWCFQKSLSIEALAAAAARMGLKSVELAGPELWPVIKKHGLICAISPSHPFTKGFAHKEEHEQCLAALRKSIDATSDAGFPSVITFSGMRRGISDGEGVANMIAGLKQIAGYAEQKKVTVCLEMLNSRVNVEMKGHPDYFCDQIERSIEVVRGVGSPRVKLLYDIYHVQIMEGDVISRIRQFKEYIGHYHTAGVPGRNELDNSQEINYPPIMEAIVATGYKGYVGQEFIPAHASALAGLAEAVRRCDV
ncbi:MAG TPA: TIM barrel protein [Pirellulales bacterium]|nr:TIM barrel protein [Pirellulales bacterium]